MADQHSLRDLLHEATHRVPGVPAHTEQPPGHQGTTAHGNSAHGNSAHGGTAHSAPGRGRNHSAGRPPRVMAAWQRRVAAFFGREI